MNTFTLQLAGLIIIPGMPGPGKACGAPPELEKQLMLSPELKGPQS